MFLPFNDSWDESQTKKKKQRKKKIYMEVKMGVEDLHTSLLEASGAAE